MRKAYERTLNILKENYDKLELIAQTLLSREKINAEEFDSLMKTGSLPEENVLAAEAADQTEAETEDTAVSEEITQNLSEESAGEQIENGSDDTVDE